MECEQLIEMTELDNLIIHSCLNNGYVVDRFDVDTRLEALTEICGSYHEGRAWYCLLQGFFCDQLSARELNDAVWCQCSVLEVSQ